MSRPRRPWVTELPAGDYLWCACGRSAERPFCDGSHAGTGVEPIPFTLSRTTTLALCCCGLSSQAPECDGRHAQLPENRPLARLKALLKGDKSG